ncbi:nitrate regulatory gene2 protein [Impatiens glandulifera]|uniref:nitrate regulatory gene2 protein n=1 Tax=Impatiens glandulifera TaxID=253017 RepID=UPI001FB06F50|nr:nitrate regulatory gene2 protein [Impatiens glandulifera]
MGASDSKPGKTEPLMLCKERKRFIEQAIDSRYAFAAAHVSYIQSLRNVGVALRRFTEAEVQKESSSLTPTSTTEVDKTPSHSSYPSPSPSPSNFTAADSPLSPPVSRLSYMKSSVGNSVSVSVGPCKNGYLNHSESMSFSMPPPPPPLPEPGSSWDYFDPSDDLESFSFMRNEEWDVDLDNVDSDTEKVLNKSLVPLVVKPALEKKEVEEREDASEFITHRAKDFLSSIRDIDHKFFRASEAGREVSRMLESNKIRVGYSVMDGRKSLGINAAFQRLCCSRRRPALVSHETSKPGMKVITWKRTTSSRSSSSRNPLKDDNDDSGSDFMEDFGMIAGSHSSTLERMYAWERKLYDEVKAIDSIRKEYNRKCDKLRHQFAKGLKSQIIDKTRAIVKNLHSRTTVALFTVDSISKRIEKMRDDELLPQLLELIHGLIRMWKSMLECHHSQYITISLAYHGKSSKANDPQIMMLLEEEIECFGVSFVNWINCHTSYIEALNSWLQHCVLKPPEQTKGRRMAFSPRRLVAPPIFILCLDWLAGIKAFPSNNVSKAVEDFLYQLRLEMEKRAVRYDSVEKEENVVDGLSGDLRCIHTSLAKLFDGLHKFSEASLKMYEDVRQKSEAARNIYSSYKQPVVRF